MHRTTRWGLISLDMAPIRGATGTIVAMSSIIHDITSRKAADKHQRFLMRELTHRSKNLLAIVQSMARQTARSATSMADFEKRYMHRLHGLAASHDLLVNQNWVGAPLDELILRQVDAFAEANRINVAISGPAVMISAKAAQTIGLALHELATNSMKYGAFSTPKGKVSIEWVYHPDRRQARAPRIDVAGAQRTSGHTAGTQGFRSLRDRPYGNAIAERQSQNRLQA